MIEKKILKIGIIGLGSIFPMHVTPVMYFKDAKLIAVCDIKEDRARTVGEKYKVPYYTDYKEMITKERPDIVHILTPHYLHAPITKFALENGVNVLCEKPMSIKLSDAEENVRIAKAKGLKYGVIFQCRYNDASQLVKKNIENGSLGRIISARAVLTWYKPDSYYVNSNWKGRWEKEGGGVVIDQIIHSLDLANWFIADEPVSVQASMCNRCHSIMEVEDTAEGFIKYKGGTTLSFWAMNNYGCDEPIEIRLFCEKGKATLSYTEAVITYNTGETLSIKQKIDPDIIYENAKDYWGFQHIKQIRQYYDSVKKNEEPEINGEEALKIQKIICAIYENRNK
jgi:predicted dehydrogenase